MAPSIGKGFLLVSGCAVVAVTRLLSPSTAEYLVGSFGYYFIAGLVVLWSWFNLRLLAGLERSRPRLKAYLPAAIVIGVATYISLSLEPTGFKVVMDEPLLASTAQFMHHDRMAQVASRGVDVNGSYDLLDGTVDKRSLLYPFLVSVLHDLTGYRVSNSFLLNALLAPFFWILVWKLGHSIRSKGIDGHLAVLLLLSAPLTSNLATSGGFDFLNGTLLVFLVFISQRLAAKPRCANLQGSLIATLGLLANNRYEGLLWALPFGLFMLYHAGAWRRLWGLNWAAFGSPWMLLIPFLHRMVDDERSWQAGPFGREAQFSLDYVASNLQSAGRYFFGLDPRSTASVLLFAVGVAGVIGVSSAAIRLLGKSTRSDFLATVNRHGAWLCLAIGSILHTGLLMSFTWGVFEEYSVARLSFPLQIVLALLGVLGAAKAPRASFVALLFTGLGIIAYHLVGTDVATFLETGLPRLLFTVSAILGLLFWNLRHKDRLVHGITAMTVVFFLLWSSSQISRHPYLGKQYASLFAFETIEKFLQSRGDERFLFVSSPAYLSILKEVPTITPEHLVVNVDVARERIWNQRAYSAVYYFQVFEHNHQKDEWEPFYPHMQHPELELELIEQVFLGISKEAHIYKVNILPKPESVDEGGT